uniref:Uncharacterized protein n=1 Tax=Meloidogyne enterolobii TaxID=390850 RepID=A0A6V7X7G9_MELEN|nr:unnamed protein product [Meloidogyne enterolobii]
MQLKKAKKLFILFVVFIHFELFVKAELNVGGMEIANKNILLRSKRTLEKIVKIGGSVGSLLAGGAFVGNINDEIQKHEEKKTDTEVLDKKPDSTKSEGKPKQKPYLVNGDYLWLTRN